MSQGSQKVYILLRNQLTKYLHVPGQFLFNSVNQKIIPLIGFLLYLFLIPQILFRVIPFSLSSNDYFTQETSKTIIQIACLYFGNLLALIGNSVFMYFVYTRKINLEKYRVNSTKLWPWQENQQNWRALFKKTIKKLLFNTNFVGILSMAIWACVFPRKVIVSEQMPSYFTIFWQLMLFMLIEDSCSTLTHSLLHSSQLYWIHKKHHEYTTSISIAAQYAHPIEFVFSNSIPTFIGFKLLAYFYPVHIVSAITWLIYRILLTSDLHSGYEFPWDFYKLLPFTAPASYHDYHHSHNVGNFASSFMVTEAIIGNNHQYYKYMESKNLNFQVQQDKSNKRLETK